MEFKDYLLYPGIAVAAVVSVYQVSKLNAVMGMIKEENPLCAQSNPNFWQLFFGAMVFITVIQWIS